MPINVKLEKFEGPLDLLLNLIEKNKIDIYDIPIVEITNQYMEYVSKLSNEDLDVVSHFMVMAATLIDIKCKMLLPREVDEDGEEVDPRAELVERLIEYKTYKLMSVELKNREVDLEKNIYRNMQLPIEIQNYVEPVDLEQLLDDITLERINQLFREAMNRKKTKMDPIRSKFGKIEKEEISLDEKIEYILRIVREKRRVKFFDLLDFENTKMGVIVVFMAILELVKKSCIKVEQERQFGDICIIYAE